MNFSADPHGTDASTAACAVNVLGQALIRGKTVLAGVRTLSELWEHPLGHAVLR